MGRSLNHFTFFNFTDEFWELTPAEQAAFYPAWFEELQEVSPCRTFYQVFPARADTEALLWCTVPLEQKDASPDSPQEVDSAGIFFDRLTYSVHCRRRWIRPTETLWGFTSPSSYARGPSAQELDPFSPNHAPYLVIYPFVKTIEWYMHGRDTRQGMMNEHIRIGHQYPEIKQLLLYSTGLQDQEFVVVYETGDLAHFSSLVSELRSSEARRYTLRDTPIYTAMRRTPEQLASLMATRPPWK
jgi:chlorite dismutase